MPDPDGVLRHIQHAEEWLRWARSDHRRGDVRAVVLRLLLADAEIRHARELGTRLAAPPRAARPSRHRMAVVGAAVALLVAAAGLSALRPAGRIGAPAGGMSRHALAAEPPPSAGAVRLEAGRLLMLGPAPAGGGQDGRGLSPGGWEYRLLPVDGDGGTGLAPTDPTSADGPAGLTTSGDPGSVSAVF